MPFNTTRSVDSLASDRVSGSSVCEKALSWSNHCYRSRVPGRPTRMFLGVDKTLLGILIALAGTLLLSAVGVFPYPFGLIVLTFLALGRFLQIKGPV